MPKSKILITGGAGFIGSHLAAYLLGHGYRVVSLDNLSTGNSRNLDGLIPNPSFNFIQGSVLDSNILEPLVQGVDTVFHLAASVGVQFVVENLIDTLETNIEGTRNVLNMAHRFGAKKVLLASTSEVYGKNPNIPYGEEDNMAIGHSSIGRWGYACSKMLDEFLGMAYYKERDLPVVVFRLFNTVGPRQSGRYGMAIPRFVTRALENKPITIYGDGNQTRCFAHVADVVRTLALLSEAPKAVGQAYNVGNDDQVSINDLVAIIIKTLGSDSPVTHIPYSEVYGPDFEDIRHRVPDISKIKDLIDYQPVNSLTQIIQDVADDMLRMNGSNQRLEADND